MSSNVTVAATSSIPYQSATTTITTTSGNDVGPPAPIDDLPTSATIRLKKKKTQRKVVWKENTVDNEGLGRKSSKCCCIYKKPHDFGESSSDSEDEDCDHCRGHVEKKASTKSK